MGEKTDKISGRAKQAVGAVTGDEETKRVGDWLEARDIHGEPARRGQIVEILGEPGHEHYKVHWDEQHESIVYPADGVHIIHKKSH
jgi:hypothetical protein